MIRWASAHASVQYSVASPPEYQIQPLCGVSSANHAACPSCSATRTASTGTGRTAVSFSAIAEGTIRSRRTATLAADMRDGVIAIPGDRPLEPLAKRGACLEAEELTRARCVQAAARLTVRHRRVPGQLSLEAGELGDRLGELANRGLDAGAEVDGLGPVVPFRGEQQSFGAVVDVEELAGRGAVAPQDDAVLAVQQLADQRGDDV